MIIFLCNLNVKVARAPENIFLDEVILNENVDYANYAFIIFTCVWRAWYECASM